MSPWIYLIAAGALEVVFATSMKYADGFSKPVASAITLIAAIGSVALLTMALKAIPLSVGYIAWMGIGAVGTVVFGLVLFGESMTLTKLLSLTVIVIGVLGLKISADA
ncbi:multidrug efflux SMR transporter [Achromobacter seleniivolatilans]|uniref:Guanidinium exporter n=1 Tax=Achromobacter seleniivolatilans TaxID=3047478 RepID=A0ABY9LU90_9BURK|nr:multidrug efflux SMR transporter [Achromobacter sp. R39]WMD18323.1 multidrug efflux SMR transporter [Achromobacter sp. R39]